MIIWLLSIFLRPPNEAPSKSSNGIETELYKYPAHLPYDGGSPFGFIFGISCKNAWQPQDWTFWVNSQLGVLVLSSREINGSQIQSEGRKQADLSILSRTIGCVSLKVDQVMTELIHYT